MVAAERVTALHRQLASFRSQLEEANIELLGQSLTDPLTAWATAAAWKKTWSALMPGASARSRLWPGLFDIDHFKLFNDRYGHLAGDEALRQVAGCLDKFSRPTRACTAMR